MKEQGFPALPIMPDLRAIAEQNNVALKRVFEKKIRGYFLIDIKDQVMKELGWENFTRYYDFRWSDVKMITGIGETAEYDICRMIVGIHRAQSIFLSDNEVRRNERSKRYKKQLVSETIEKIKFRRYGSVYFRKKVLFQGEEFLYYPLPYELFVMSVKMGEMLMDEHPLSGWQLYYGVIYNGISALSLLEDNLLGTAYPLCRGAIEMYLKLLILSDHTESYRRYEEFRMLEVEQSCTQIYPKKFNTLFEKRTCHNSKSKAEYLHFGWVDFVDEYHNIVKKSPYSVYGITTFLKNRKVNKNSVLEQLEGFYKLCHAYTHGSIQIAKYPALHYFEVSLMLYHIVRDVFLMLCKEKKVETMVEGLDIISIIDRDFKVLYEQYGIRSTENFEKYYDTSSVRD